MYRLQIMESLFSELPKEIRLQIVQMSGLEIQMALRIVPNKIIIPAAFTAIPGQAWGEAADIMTVCDSCCHTTPVQEDTDSEIKGHFVAVGGPFRVASPQVKLSRSDPFSKFPTFFISHTYYHGLGMWMFEMINFVTGTTQELRYFRRKRKLPELHKEYNLFM